MEAGLPRRHGRSSATKKIICRGTHDFTLGRCRITGSRACHKHRYAFVPHDPALRSCEAATRCKSTTGSVSSVPQYRWYYSSTRAEGTLGSEESPECRPLPIAQLALLFIHKCKILQRKILRGWHPDGVCERFDRQALRWPCMRTAKPGSSVGLELGKRARSWPAAR